MFILYCQKTKVQPKRKRKINKANQIVKINDISENFIFV